MLNASQKFKRTPAGNIPVDWGCVHLRQVISSLDAGTSVSGVDRQAHQHEIGVLKVSAVSGGRFRPSENKAILSPEEASRVTVRPEMGSIIISRSKSPDLVGDAALVNIQAENLFLPDKLWQIQAVRDFVVEPWLLHVLQDSRVKLEIRNRATGTSDSMKNISKESFLSISIPLPPLSEQRRIAAILTAWDQALANLDAIIEAKERHKKALVQHLLSVTGSSRSLCKKVRMSDVLQRVFRPVDWSPQMSLSLVSVRRRCGGLFRRPEMPASEYKTQDLHELKTDDFLISKRQVVHGAWALVSKQFAGSHVSKEYAILANMAPERLSAPYFAWLSQTPRMIRLARVSSTGVHLEKLIFDPDVFLREFIWLPDKQTQDRVANVLDSAETELSLLCSQRQAINQQKRGLMQRLLTGKLRVKA